MLGLLQRYLGKYVYGLDAESLRISVWRGDVELSNLRLKPEALDELNLPITVKSGLLGRLRLKVGAGVFVCWCVLQLVPAVAAHAHNRERVTRGVSGNSHPAITYMPCLSLCLSTSCAVCQHATCVRTGAMVQARHGARRRRV